MFKNDNVIPSCQALLNLTQRKPKNGEKWFYINDLISKLNKVIFQVLKMGGPDREKLLRISHLHYEDDKLFLKRKVSLLQLILHSTRILIELLHPMLHHNDMNNQNLHNITPSIKDDEIGRNEPKSSKKKKKKCYLFLTETVYSITTVKACNVLKKDYYRILDVFKKSSVEQKTTKIDKNITTSLINQTTLWNEKKTWDQKTIIQDTLSLFTQGNDESCKKNISTGIELDNAFLTFINISDEASRAERADNLKNLFSKAIGRHFPGTALYIYGSCANQLSLGRSFDVDLSLTTTISLKAKKDLQLGKIDLDTYTKERNSHMFKIRNVLRKISQVQFCMVITNARVPVIKGKAYVGKSNRYSPNNCVDFDICLMNDVAVANSSLIKEYCNFGDTHKILLLVKAWVKTHRIGSAADGMLSSYSWMILTIFYLQCIGYVPNLQNKDLIPQEKQNNVVANHQRDICTNFASFREKSKKKWKKMINSKIQKLPNSAIFLGFLKFYAHVFPYGSAIVSICNNNMLPKTVFDSCCLWRFCIEDPFETFDCCTPHDLGIHIGENGQDIILYALRKCFTKLENIFSDIPDQQLDMWMNLLDYFNPKAISKEIKGLKKKGIEADEKVLDEKKNHSGKPEESMTEVKRNAQSRSRHKNNNFNQSVNKAQVKKDILEVDENVMLKRKKRKNHKNMKNKKNYVKTTQNNEEVITTMSVA